MNLVVFWNSKVLGDISHEQVLEEFATRQMCDVTSGVCPKNWNDWHISKRTMLYFSHRRRVVIPEDTLKSSYFCYCVVCCAQDKIRKVSVQVMRCARADLDVLLLYLVSDPCQQPRSLDTVQLLLGLTLFTRNKRPKLVTRWWKHRFTSVTVRSEIKY